MSEPRSLDERLLEKETQLKKLLEKADQYKAQLKQLQIRKAEENRKIRTHKLIVCGAEIASVFGRPLEEDEVKSLAEFLREQKDDGILAFLNKDITQLEGVDIPELKTKEFDNNTGMTDFTLF